ncbi:hypothetical protein ACI3L0_000350 [Candidozyma auris]
MILINDAKYACMECIRGHRSSMCRHHQRPLLQVRSKGRPNIGTGNKNHRIAVFAEEVASSPEPEEGDSCKDYPVVILKASDKQVIDLSNGQILGPYDEKAHEVQSRRPIIHSDSFINSSSCCSKGASRVTKQCSCNKSAVSRTKILKSYFDKHKNDKFPVKSEVHVQPAKSTCCSSKKQANATNNNDPHTPYPNPTLANPYLRPNLPQDSPMVSSNIGQLPVQSNSYPHNLFTNVSFPSMSLPPFVPMPEMSYNSNHVRQETYSNLASSNTGEVFEVVNVPSCSISGTCRCTDACNCPGCVEHNNAPKPPAQIHLDSLRNDAQYSSNLILTSKEQPKKISEKPGTQPIPPTGSVPKDFDTYANFLRSIIGESASVGQDSGQTEVESVNNSEDHKCECPDDACFCTNCEAHGIIDGYRLDDIFTSRAALENHTIKQESINSTGCDKHSPLCSSVSLSWRSSDSTLLGMSNNKDSSSSEKIK